MTVALWGQLGRLSECVFFPDGSAVNLAERVICASVVKMLQDRLINLPPEIPAQRVHICDQTSMEGHEPLVWFDVKALTFDSKIRTLISLFFFSHL